MKTSGAFNKTIKSYLEQRAKEDELFAVSYAKQNKSVDKCCNFILQQVQKSGCNGFSDDEIFGMAVHYYDEDDIKNIGPINCKVVVNHVVELTDEDKKQVEQEVVEELKKAYKKKLEAEQEEAEKLFKKLEEANKKKIEKKIEKKIIKQGDQPSLFD
ncbi:PcfK-like family protein [uncultured Bacteroides sp.]|uniref:PcfK-like family protein n=1 Tax=uncultured Bacteroides sp. TaxID=162156 RepID=UPI002AA93EA0|nr:PcfK-like family protein [uncultured Bacteroides sp.]